MSNIQDRSRLQKYRVRVGLAECTVCGTSEDQAIQEARRQLNQEMPNLSEVIRGIKDKEFRVDRVG